MLQVQEKLPDDIDLRAVVRSEYQKCFTDPVYFMRKYCMIQHPVKGRMLFNLYSFQEDTLRDLQTHDYNIVLKSRQLGISTVAAGYACWLMTFFEDKNVLVIATTQDVSKNLVTKVRFMYQNLPSWLREPFVEDNKLSLKLKNGSQIKAVASSENSGRSEAISLLLIDEAAFIASHLVEHIWTAAQQTLGTGGRALVMSTPNGQGNWFHRIWVSAENGENEFNTIKLPWYVHPDRDDSWRLKQDKLLGLNQAAQECLAGHHTVMIRDNLNHEFNIRLDSLYNIYDNNENKLNDYLILTPSGYQKFGGMKKTTKTEYVEIRLNNGQKMISSTNHKFISNGNKIFAEDLRFRDVLDTPAGPLMIIGIRNFNNSEIDLYDIIEVDNGHLFICDNIIVSNCDADFLSSGATFIHPEELDYYSKNFITEPGEKKGNLSEMYIYEHPDPGHTYLICADVARGDGGDYSAFHVLDVLDNGLIKQVVEFKGKIDTDNFAKLLYNVATDYNNGLLVVENNNIGWAVLNKLVDLRYINLYYTYKNDPFIDISTQVRKGYDLKDNKDMVPGFTTTQRTRSVMLEKLEEYIREKTIIIQSKRTLTELQVFVWNNNRAEAMKGYNDDLVMSLSIGIWVRETALRMRQHGLNLTKKTLSGIVKTGGVDSISSQGKAYWNMPASSKLNKSDSDISWLLK